jgi:hypothetical protein
VIFRLGFRAALVGVAAFAVAALAPVPGEAVLAGALVLLGALTAAELVRVIARVQGGTRESAFERALGRRPAAAPRPDDLVRLEDQVAMAVSLASDLHARLRPLVAEVAAQRLRTRHGVDLERRPDAARALLGEEAWELVRPDAAAPADRFARGISSARLARCLDAVEAL